jgi:hypothetical protein
MSSPALFQRFWRDVGADIKVVVDRHATVLFPDEMGIRDVGGGEQEFYLHEPVMFYGAPLKGGSRKAGGRRAIFVDGTFRVRPIEGGFELVQGACNLVVYDSVEAANTSYELTLIDAMHFDIEAAEAQREFHPIFHAQRGYSTLITRDKVIGRAMAATRMTEDKIAVDDRPVNLEFVRLPSPQMDMLSVLATVVADFFCSKEHSRRQEKDAFHCLLKRLLGEKNPMRESVSSKALSKRWGDRPPFAAAHWYKESGG